MGNDKTLFWVFERNAHRLAESVTCLINLCLKIGRFPSATNTAKVIFYRRKNPLKQPVTSNLYHSSQKLRGIQRKFFTCFIRLISTFLNKNKLGFREMSSPSNAPIDLQIYSVQMEDLVCDCVHNDEIYLSKAFDRLRYLDIIEALRRTKRSVITFALLVNIDFPKARIQRLVFQGDISNSLPKNRRAPPGGVNSRAYYNLSVADIDSLCVNENALSSFADDSKILCAEFMCPISKGPTDNAHVKVEFSKSFFEKKLYLNAESPRNLFFA